ncbi:MAG: hypothetical protein HYS81_04760 [Candidatus Aenigmatarchaeota archaeon]|nr:MAG: hypothetical protein HYS81_04760 [Candidatus Aenigmarchaeota archaeon]
MQALFLVPGKNADAVKDIVGVGNNSVSKRTFVTRTAKDIGLSGDKFYFMLLLRPNDKAYELLKSLLSKVANEESVEERTRIRDAYNKSLGEDDDPLKGDVAVWELTNVDKARNVLGIGTESIERQTIIFKDATQFGYEKGQVLLIDGADGACALARELLTGLVEEVTGAKKDEIIKKIYDEEQKAFEGFGGIFG